VRKFKATLKESSCPVDIAGFVVYMALTKNYVSAGYMEDSTLYQRCNEGSPFVEVDASHDLPWRFRDFNNFENGANRVEKKLTKEGERLVLHFLNSSFRGDKFQGEFINEVYKDQGAEL